MKRVIWATASAAVALAAVLAAAVENPWEVAEEYYEKSVFIKGTSGPRLLSIVTDNGTAIYVSAPSDNDGPWDLRRGGERPAQKVDAAGEAVEKALNKAGISGQLLGTYSYNSTHVVTLVEEAPLKIYALE